MRLQPGLTIADGRLRLERRLGAGGMASVWLGHDERLDRLVAIKVVADTLADDPGWLARFTREARAAAGLSHPNIVQVFDYGVEDGRPYLVMEHIAGSDLSEHLADPSAAVVDPQTFARELLGAVAHVHGAGIVHRDIKPANILLDALGRAHVTDFGIALSADATSLTQTGMVIGTIRYLAPEVAAGAPADEASDLYSAGMVIGEVAGPAPTPAVAALISALTEHDPRDRVRSATAALELLSDTSPTRPRTAATHVIAQRHHAAPTRVQPPGPHAHTEPTTPHAVSSPVLAGLRARGIQPLHAAAALAVVLAIIVVVVLNTGAGSPTQQRSPSTAPAPAGAPLTDQLRALDRIVDDATAR